MTKLELLADLVAHARAAGADAADAVLISSQGLGVSRRLGRTDHLERSELQDLGLRVFLGKRQAIVSSTSADPAGFALLAERALDMARVVPEDPWATLLDAPPFEALALDIEEESGEPSAQALIARAAAAEEAALAVHGVTNSEGGEAGWSRTEVALATSLGFAGSYARTRHSVSASAVAGTGTGMQRDYDYSSAIHLADLESPEEIGRSAGGRAVARLDPKRPRTAQLPVVYDPRVAGSLVGHLAGAANGASVARGTTFLKDKMGERLFAPGTTIRDDPHRQRGLRSSPFDGEGQPTTPLALVDDGHLAAWLLDGRSARQLGLVTNARAGRGTGGPPSPGSSNLYLAAGTATPAELMADIAEGLYIMELMGSSINGLTGDYSRGAAGFMIRGGEIAEPVAEITIAGNLIEIFRAMVPANDLVFKRGTDAPTVRVDGMTMAGA